MGSSRGPTSGEERTVAAPLDGVRVLVAGRGVAVRYGGHLLSRLGAHVARSAPPRGDDVLGHGGAAGRAYGAWLDDGTHAADRSDGPWDLVLTGQDDDELAAAADLVAEVVGATVVEVRWFSADGPYAATPGTDEVVLALCGLAHAFGEPSGPPTLAQGHVPQILAGANACGLAIAALLAPPERRPAKIEVEVLGSTMCLTETGPLAYAGNPRAVSQRVGVDRFVPTYPCSSYRADDGWVGITCLTPTQWSALCAAIDRPDVAADSTYATAVRRLWRADEVDEILAPAIAARAVEEWVAVGLDRRIPITAVPEPGDLPDIDHWRHRGAFGAVADTGLVGPTLPFTLRHDGRAQPRWGVDPEVAGPLSGLRVLDLTMGWAGPSTTRTLADLGADVVKVESDAHPDWWRGWEARSAGDPPSIEVQPHFNSVNRNKRSVAIDLGSEEGRAAVLSLVEHADVVIDNFAVGVTERLGVGVDALLTRRPGIVVVSMPAFGTDGPLAGVRAYGSTVEQASGLPFVNGRADWPPSLQHVAFGDPVGGVFGIVATLAALAGRDRLGGAAVDLAQVACLFELGADAILAAQVDGRVERTGNRRARCSLCCVVPTVGEDEWLAVVVDTDAGWHGLLTVLGAERWRDDPDLSTVAGRAARADEFEAAIAAWAAPRPAHLAAERLHAAGVSAAPVHPAHTRGADPHLRATGYWQELDRRHVGRHLSGGPAFRLDGVRPAARSSAPILGEHTGEVFDDPRWTGTPGG